MRKTITMALMALSLCACTLRITPSGTIDSLPETVPDYIGVTVPETIAPLNFSVADPVSALRLVSGDTEVLVKGPDFRIPEDGWRKLCAASEAIEATVLAKQGGKWLSYKPFSIIVSRDPIDESIAYRLIEPGYETWNAMGLYMRSLSCFDQTPIITNEKTGGNCMNCHSFAGRDASRMVFHMRASNGGTYVVKDGKVEKLNTKTPETISAVVYPQWSNDGRFIAFSVNDIAQAFHSTNPNRVEVYDYASDVVVYDVEAHELVSTSLLMDAGALETYPTFSPDGKKIYFCKSPVQDMPEGYRDVRYSICSIDFDPETRRFGFRVETLCNADETGLGAVMPRVSPDGRWLMFTQTAYGCFPIWHKDADLCLLDLQTREVRALEGANSDDVDSYHSWSTNSRWVVFSSRRMDGLYTRPFITHIDEEGRATKPFVLPQEDPGFYHSFMRSYNIPEFVNGTPCAGEKALADIATGSPGTDITFAH